MNQTSQRAIIWCLIVAGPLMAVTFWPLAGFIPLPKPTQTAQDVAAMYAGNAANIRVAMMAWVFLWTVWLPFSGVVAAQLAPRERGFPLWALIQFGGGLMLSMIVILASLLWGLCAFRPERAPEVVQAIHDLGWFLFTMPAGPLGMQILAVGIVALTDKAPDAPFPRWFGFMSIWVFTLTMPGFLIILFKTGPFAWNGLLALWMPACVLGVWMSCLIPLLLKAIAASGNSQSHGVSFAAHPK